MKISKRTREQAALICAMAGSTRTGLSDAHGAEYPQAWTREANEVWRLALSAHNRAYSGLARVVSDMHGDRYWQALLEAEALLRTGWTP